MSSTTRGGARRRWHFIAWWFLWQAWTAAPFGPPEFQTWQFRAAGQAGPFRDQVQCEEMAAKFVTAQARPWSLIVPLPCWDSWKEPAAPSP